MNQAPVWNHWLFTSQWYVEQVEVIAALGYLRGRSQPQKDFWHHEHDHEHDREHS
jgi:hypothetical protein